MLALEKQTIAEMIQEQVGGDLLQIQPKGKTNLRRNVGDYYGSWRAMEELYKKGIIRAIGVCNFMPDRLMDLVMNNEMPPAINRVELRGGSKEMKDSKSGQ